MSSDLDLMEAAMEELTNEQVRAIVTSRKAYGRPLIVVVRPYVGEDRYELYFHLQWVSSYAHYEACPAHVENDSWWEGDVYEIPSEIAEAFKGILFRLYGIEHVCFNPIARRKASVQKVLGPMTVLPR